MNLFQKYTRSTLTCLCIIIAFFSTPTHTTADIPQKPPLVKYTGLWTDSPFTSRPPPPSSTEALNPLNDFTLTGIAPVPGGYRITIINKKNPELKKIIEPGTPCEFTLIAITRNPEKTLGTTVTLTNGTAQATLTFEKDLLTLKSTLPPQPPQNLPPPGIPAQQPQLEATPAQDPNNPQRQPRPRIVPPPAAYTPQTQPRTDAAEVRRRNQPGHR